jgi:hypothetical protein
MKTSPTQFFLEFMQDDLAGSYVVSTSMPGYQGQTSISENYITVMAVDKSSVGAGITQLPSIPSDVLLFPNPTSDAIQIDLKKETRDVQINVRDIVGKLISTYNLKNEKQLSIHLKGEAGIYFIEILSGEGRGVYKIEKL